MQFTTLALSALSIGSALADIKVHVVKVGNANATLVYSPNNIVAAVGDMVQFQFAPANHTVTQSTFAAPCQPIGSTSNVTGVFSGFMPVSASDSMTPTYTIMINSTTPMWLYCSQGKHCQNGMSMVINENTATNKTLEAYQTAAKGVATSLAPGETSNGTAGSTTNTGSGTSTGSASTTSSSSASTQTGSYASTVKAPVYMGLLAVGLALFI